MKRAQVQAAIRSRALSRKGRNAYTQGGKRDKVAWGYSDCSSFARWCIKMVLGTDIGSYTGAQVTSKNMTTTHSGGSAPDMAKLEVGDLVYFWSPKSTYAHKVNHVEVYMGGGRTLGHGSGTGPTAKILADYCKTMNYLMTRRPNAMEKTWVLGGRIIEKGAYGEDVQALQLALIAMGYSVGSYGADWDCGDATDAAIRRFQKANKLVVDGQFGPKSLAVLNALLDVGAVGGDESLTEDDYPEPSETGGEDSPGDEPANGTDDSDVGIPQKPNPEASGSLGIGATNPYPKPTSIKRKGASGAAVKWIQWELRQSGYEIGAYGANKDGIDGLFGTSTLSAVKKFQKDHVDANGKALVVDGEVGPKTIAALLAATNPGSDDGSPADEAGQEGVIYDVSSYDGKIDFAKVAALTGKQRCLMMIIRAQASKLDEQLQRNIEQCKKYSIPYGVYAYTYASTESAGAADADVLYNRVVAAGGEPLCWVIDAEEGKNTKKSTEAMRAQLRKRIGAGGAIWFYSYDSRVRGWSDIMKNYDAIWTARWNNPDIAPGYTNYDLWQFGYTNVPGIRKTTDTSRLHPKKTLAQVLKQRAK